MAAPKGNRFWEARSSHGRKPKFEDAETLWNACLEYFDWVEKNPLSEGIAYQGKLAEDALPKMRAMTIGGLCNFLDITQPVWAEYRAREDFLYITTRVDEVIRQQKFEGASAGLLNPNIIARDLGLADKREHTGANGGPIEVAALTEDQRKARIAELLAKRNGAHSD